MSSYHIIFETHLTTTSDGKYLLLSRTGCNNDTHGRDRQRLNGQLFTRAELEEYIARLRENDFSCKLRGKMAETRDYGEYLNRLLAKNIPTFQEFVESRECFYAEYANGVYLFAMGREEYNPPKYISLDEYSRLRIKGESLIAVVDRIHLWSEAEVLERFRALAESKRDKLLEFKIGKKKKRAA